MEIGPRIALGSAASSGVMTIAQALGAPSARSSVDAGERLAASSPRRAVLIQATAEACAALEAAVDAVAVAEARVRSATDALEDALQHLAETEAPSALPRQRQLDREDLVGALSPREREVLALVATGRSNKAIADELFVSPNSIKTHVASLLTKLRADTRVHLAVIAARQLAS